MNIKRGDTVKVLYGKDSGKTGVVVSVLNKKVQVLVSGLNKVVKHIKGDGKKRKSEITSVERPLPVAKVMLVCPSCNKPTRINSRVSGFGFVRVCKKCGKEFDKKTEKLEKKVVEDKKTKVKSVKKK